MSHALLEGYFRVPHDRPPKWLFMFTAYVDESGHELDCGWTFLAGFLGNDEQWNNFVPKWKVGLGPQRKSLHMAALRWDKDRTRLLLERLGSIPEESHLHPIMAGVRHEDYADLVADKPYKKQLKGYLVCLHALVIQVLREIPDDERLEMVFEEQKEYEPFANLILAIAAHQGPRTSDGFPKLAKWNFIPKGTTIMTDPADYFAFALAKVWGPERYSKRAQWCYPILQSGQGVGYGKIMERDEIRPIITDIVNPIFDRLDAQSADGEAGHGNR